MLAARRLVNITRQAAAALKQNHLYFLWAPVHRINHSKSFSTNQKLHVNMKDQEEAHHDNWQGRVELAAAFRGLEMLDFHEGICNHLSLLVPAANGDGSVMLINPYGYHWKEIRPEYLLGVNTQGEIVEGKGEVDITAMTIHLGIHNTRPDAKCAFHLHPPYSTAMAMLKDPHFGMYHQNSTMFYNDFAYDRDYSGYSLDVDEGNRTSKHIGDKHVLFMCSHGVMVVGKSVADVFYDVYYLERACMHQVLAMSTGKELCEIPEEFCKMNKEFYESNRSYYSSQFFDSIKRLIEMKN